VAFGIDLATVFEIEFKPLPVAAMGGYAISAFSPKTSLSINAILK
jgi:hypothetical protein